jgi:hypothetical protein
MEARFAGGSMGLLFLLHKRVEFSALPEAISTSREGTA